VMAAKSDWDAFVDEKTGTALKLTPPPSEPVAALKGKKQAVELFAFQCRERMLPAFVRELPFAKQLKRNWKFDFAWGFPHKFKLAVEIEGIVMRRSATGEWLMGGRHATIQGYKEDNVKYFTASLLGWNVLRFEQSQVRSKFAIEATVRWLASRGWTAQS
jgi:hypothetical protein